MLRVFVLRTDHNARSLWLFLRNNWRALAADDAPQGVDHETGEIITPAAQIEHQPPAMTIPQQTIQKVAEGALRQDQKEEAAIREREMEESGQPSTGRRIRQRGLDIE